MEKKRDTLSTILRVLIFAIFIQIISGIISDLGDPYVPFGMIVAFYLFIFGIPLLIALAFTTQYFKLKGIKFWVAKKSELLRMIAYSFPFSGVIRLCWMVLLTGRPKHEVFEECMNQLVYYFIVGALLFLTSKSKKLQKWDRSDNHSK